MQNPKVGLFVSCEQYRLTWASTLDIVSSVLLHLSVRTDGPTVFGKSAVYDCDVIKSISGMTQTV